MSEADFIGTKPTRISSEEILQRAFPTKVRGISESEVRSFLRRIADDFEKLETREEQLLEQIRQLEQNLENRPKVTKQELLENLGEETARVLTNAENAAEKMLQESQEEATRLINDATKKAEEILSAAQDNSDSQLQSMQMRVRTMHQNAQRDVETLVEEAKTFGREIFQDAVIVREKILKDLLRRRDLLLEQIDELRKGREELLESYKIVKGSFQKATDSLHAVEEKASTELMSQQIDVDELLKAPVDLPVVLESEHKLPSQIDLTEDEIVLETNETIEEVEPELVTANTNTATSAAAGGVTTIPSDKKKGFRGYMKDALGVSEEPKPEVINPDEASNISEQESIAIKIVDTPEIKIENEEEVENTTNTKNKVEDKPAEKKDVGELFKSLKEQQPEPKVVKSEDAEKNVDDVKTKDEAKKEKPAAKKKAKVKSAIETRNEVITKVSPSIVKKAKKHLQDEQNEVLDNIRTIKSKKYEAKDVLPEQESQLKSWEAAIASDLEEIFLAGAKTVSNSKPKYSQESLNAAINWVMAPLRETLTLAVEEGDQAEASSRVGAKYREWRNTELQNALYDAMASAYNNGVLANANKDATLKWVVEKSGHCPDCDDNALEPTSAGENFPTGQIAPPAHSGCKCVLVVA